MKESLYKLLELQEIDKEIHTLRQSQMDFPGEIQNLQKELQTAKDLLEAKQQQSEDVEKHHRALERDLEAIEADLKKHQDRLYEVKTNKEYDALQLEIEALQNRKSQHESAIIESIQTSDDLKAKVAEDKTHYLTIEKTRKSQIGELTSQLNSVEANVKGWVTKREAIETHVERRSLGMYNRIRKVVKGGVAIVVIKKGACGGCFRQLSPQRMVEARRCDNILRCENCGRILVWKEEEEVAV
jgi:predicted  nucleic acid-binding Zn-ribbon protein